MDVGVHGLYFGFCQMVKMASWGYGARQEIDGTVMAAGRL